MDDLNISEIETEVDTQAEGEEIETEPVDPDDEGWADVTWGDASDEDSEDELAEPEDEDKPVEPEKPSEEADKSEASEPEQADDADEYLEVKFLHETRKVGKEEAKTLVQKGLNYDHVVEERDTMRADYDKLKGYENFLNELKGEFPTVEALIDDTRARMLADKEGISYADATAKVKNMYPEQPAKPEKPSSNQTMGDDAVQKFVAKYPNVKAEDIPAEVWDEVRETGDLLGAYEKNVAFKERDNRIAALEAEIKTLKQNSKNAARSAGSASSSGNTSAKSKIQQLWEEDDY